MIITSIESHNFISASGKKGFHAVSTNRINNKNKTTIVDTVSGKKTKSHNYTCICNGEKGAHQLFFNKFQSRIDDRHPWKIDFLSVHGFEIGKRTGFPSKRV